VTVEDLLLTPTGLRFGGRVYPCVIGKGGIRRDKQEGDGATPVGTHRIVGMYYRPDRLPPPVSWAIPIGPRDLWCDDPAMAAYNHAVTAPFDGSHERMYRADPLYDLILVTDWNWPIARPGEGSAIFIHQWRRPGYPTEGCVALKRSDLHSIAARLTPRSRLIVRERG